MVLVLSLGLIVTLVLAEVSQPPSAASEVRLESKPDLNTLPSISQWRVEAGFELEVAHSKLRVWPTLAVSGPWISTRSGATGSWQRINFWRHTSGGNFHGKLTCDIRMTCLLLFIMMRFSRLQQHHRKVCSLERHDGKIGPLMKNYPLSGKIIIWSAVNWNQN